MSEAAARLDDPIEHSSALGGLLAGLAIGAGAVLVGIAIVGTGGLGAVALCAMVGAGAATGAGIGQLFGSLSFARHGAGQIKTGSGNVFINSKAAARAHVDTAVCDQHGPAPQILAQGSDSVYINGQPAARVGDRTVCDGKISAGSGNVFIGGGTETTDAIDPEVPEWLERAVLIVGLASAFVLASPVIVIAGLVGGIAGGLAGNWAGGELFGQGSNGQKLMAFGGALLGGGLGAKGGKWFDARYEVKVQGLGSNLGNVSISKRNDLAKAGEDLYVGTYNQVRGGNIKGGLNATHTPHHAIQNAVSPTTHGKGITINLRKDLHELTWTYKKPLVKGLTERQYLARDAADVRGILKNAGYSRQVVNRQVGELIKQNKELWKTLGQ